MSYFIMDEREGVIPEQWIDLYKYPSKGLESRGKVIRECDYCESLVVFTEDEIESGVKYCSEKCEKAAYVLEQRKDDRVQE